MGDTKTLLAARAEYNKNPGFLYLTDLPNRLVWVNQSTGQPELNLGTDSCTNLFANANKPGVGPKLRVVADGTPHNFLFTAADPKCIEDRDSFKNQLKDLMAIGMQAQPTPAASTPSTPLPKEEKPEPKRPSQAQPQPQAQQTHQEQQQQPQQQQPKTDDTQNKTPKRPPVPQKTKPAIDPEKVKAAEEYRIKQKLLTENPDLGLLHRDVVIHGPISEQDFWATRAHLVHEESIARAQKKGKASQLVDPRPGVGQSGAMKVTMTPQLVRSIFEDWPVVARAHQENVPQNMTEGEFWKRYFESRLYHNHRASVRSSAVQHVIKEDAIFDQYLEAIDDELEPRNQRQDPVSLAVDLLSTREDHGETGNTQDFTMQAGRQRATLPLIRKFNEHSERLLNSALGDVRPVKRRRLDVETPDNNYAEIVIDDLNPDDGNLGAALDMKDRQRYFEGRTGTTNEATGVVDYNTALQSMKILRGMDGLTLTYQPNPPAMTKAVRLMADNIKARMNVKQNKTDVSTEFMNQMKSLQSTTNEYIRQFWVAIYASSESTPPMTNAQRSAKASAMMNNLSAIPTRIDEMVKQAQNRGWDGHRVQQAFVPLMGALNKAKSFWEKK